MVHLNKLTRAIDVNATNTFGGGMPSADRGTILYFSLQKLTNYVTAIQSRQKKVITCVYLFGGLS